MKNWIAKDIEDLDTNHKDADFFDHFVCTITGASQSQIKIDMYLMNMQNFISQFNLHVTETEFDQVITGLDSLQRTV